jgi:two-component system osmolarity sensor histidine kinase EnvZ
LVDVKESWIQVQVQLEKGALIITAPEKRLFSSSGYIFLLWMIGISTVLMLVAVLFMRNQIRPIKRLAIAADRFGKGREVPFFKLEGAREVRQAARAFLGMRERINRQIQQRTAMLAGVSHDLRTPLTRMKLQAEMMAESDDVKALRSDINDMERMIDGYLQFARGEGDEVMERVDMMEILRRIESNYVRNGLDISIESKMQNFEIFLRPIAFERCMTNVISNAQKYATKVNVKVKSDDDFVYILVDDDGIGIDEDHYEDVFKPFFREDKSRNTKTGGVGLGLPIAKDIVLAHGGDITLDRSPQKGLRVIISLPI